MVSRDRKVDYFASSLFFFFFFFLLIIIKSGLLAGIRWSVCMLKSHRSLCVAFSRTGAGLCIYHLLVWSNLNFLHIYQWITLPTQSCLAIYSLSAIIIIIKWISCFHIHWEDNCIQYSAFHRHMKPCILRPAKLFSVSLPLWKSLMKYRETKRDVSEGIFVFLFGA